ncbi:MAG TPA: DUF2877 domain-containing protein [Anaerolineae bacterium]|nr:DUF2877 domain-containing protein [Anaerolineae bacterium]
MTSFGCTFTKPGCPLSPMTKAVPASLIAPRARRWLAESSSARILHLFDHACNLINDQGNILSLVAPEIGAGPFALVLPLARPFSTIFSLQDKVDINDNILRVGLFEIDITDAAFWQPIPDWQRLRRNTAVWRTWLPQLQDMTASYRRRQGIDVPSGLSARLEAGAALFLRGLVEEDTAVCCAGVQKLAGLGQGLTPAGDDFLLGAMYGLRVRERVEAARFWNELIVDTAVPRTTALSAAWLRAAAQGEAVTAWHEFCRHSAVADRWGTAVQRILRTGHSSGVDALTGFTAVLVDTN